MSKRNTFIIAVALPILILLAMTIKPAATVLYGQEITLETQAVDPNDLFRGDYVALNFKITEIPVEKLPDSFKHNTGRLGKNLYVSLKPQGQFYVIDQVSENKPSSGIYLQGKIQYYRYDQSKEMTPINGTGEVKEMAAVMNYSLDKYFVSQGAGIELQNHSAKGELMGRVKVLNGYGILTGVEPVSK